MKPTDAPYIARCAGCHKPLGSPPEGARAGLCPGLACLQLTELTLQRARDFLKVAELVANKRMTFEVEPETGITWLTQLAPKPPPPAIVGYTDDGRIRYRDPGSPTGQTWYSDLDVCIGGDDPRLDRYRDLDDDDGLE